MMYVILAALFIVNAVDQQCLRKMLILDLHKYIKALTSGREFIGLRQFLPSQCFRFHDKSLVAPTRLTLALINQSKTMLTWPAIGIDRACQHYKRTARPIHC